MGLDKGTQKPRKSQKGWHQEIISVSSVRSVWEKNQHCLKEHESHELTRMNKRTQNSRKSQKEYETANISVLSVGSV